MTDAQDLKLLLTECANELEAYVDAEYPLETRQKYPQQMVRYNRNMGLVRAARAAAGGASNDG